MQRVFRNPATVIISALLLILIATGIAQAAVGSNGIKDNSVQSKDIKNNSLNSSDVKDGSLTTNDVKNDSLTSNDVKANSLKAADLAPNSVGSSEITNESIAGADIKNGTVGSGDLANGSVTANKIAPGAIAFPNTLWGPMIRNQQGAAQSSLQTGPAGQPMGEGSLMLAITGPDDRAAFGDSIDFAGIELDDITNISYSSYNAANPPLVRPSLRIEINPHLVSDATIAGATEFSTLTFEPDAGATGWVTHSDALTESNWFLSGDAGVTTGCNNDAAANLCTLDEVRALLNDHVDDDTAPPAISTGLYFGLGSGITPPTQTAVDEFVFNGFVFDFEPTGVFLSPITTP